MTTDNASGAGMETVAWQWRKRHTWFAGQADECHFWSEWEALQPPYMDARDLATADPENYEIRPLVLRTDATRLLAESQAHNAKLEADWRAAYEEKQRDLLTEIENGRKLEAQVERLRGDLKLIAESIYENEDWLRAVAARAALEN